MSKPPLDVFDAIISTRAVRRFRDDPVTDDEISHCIRAAVHGPSGGNIQPWQFLAVTDAELKRGIGDVYRRAYDRYEATLLKVRPPSSSLDEEAAFVRMVRASRHLADHMGRIPAMVLVLMPSISMTLEDPQGPLDVGTPYASVYPAVQNFMLAARGLGIGTTLTTVYRIYQSEVRALCGVPERYEIIALIPMGRPAGAFGPGRRRAPERVTHWNRFGAKREPPPA
jgi:nitroreductase